MDDSSKNFIHKEKSKKQIFIVKFEPEDEMIGILKRKSSTEIKIKKKVRFNPKVKVKTFYSKRNKSKVRKLYGFPKLKKSSGCTGGGCVMF